MLGSNEMTVCDNRPELKSLGLPALDFIICRVRSAWPKNTQPKRMIVVAFSFLFLVRRDCFCWYKVRICAVQSLLLSCWVIQTAVVWRAFPEAFFVMLSWSFAQMLLNNQPFALLLKPDYTMFWSELYFVLTSARVLWSAVNDEPASCSVQSHLQHH